MCDIIFCRLTCSLAVPTCFNPSQNQSWLVSRQIHRRLEHSTKRLGTSIIFRRNMFYLFDYLLSFCCWLHPLFPFRTSTFLLGISIDWFFSWKSSINSDISVMPLAPWPSQWRLLGGTRGSLKPRYMGNPLGLHHGHWMRKCNSARGRQQKRQTPWKRQWDILVTFLLLFCWLVYTDIHTYIDRHIHTYDIWHMHIWYNYVCYIFE